MSNTVVSEATKEADVCCADCGITGVVNNGAAAVDDIKSKECTECHSARSCGGDNCREEHQEQQEQECKERADELRDKNLFRQPDISHLGECPICFLPMPLDPSKSVFEACCSKLICQGCVYENYKSSKKDSVKALKCPFCREPVSSGDNETLKRLMKRIKANDPAALRQMGVERHKEGDLDGAFEYLTKAADLGDSSALYRLGIMYWKGEGVEKDEEKMVYHWEKAAIGGDPNARHNLGCNEAENGRVERSVKHFIIAANLGHEGSMKALWKHYSLGNITKEDLEATLRTHQAAIDEMRSSERDDGEIALKELGLLTTSVC